MAYETGTATGVNDLLNKLATFIEANGWTRDSLGDESTGRRYHAHRGSVYINFRSFVAETLSSEIRSRGTSTTGVAFNVGTGYDGGVAWHKQAGVPAYSAGSSYFTAGLSNVAGTIPAYHFFAHNSGDNIVVVVEHSSGQYQYLLFGTATKYGSFTGGEYFIGSGTGVSAAVIHGIGFYPSNVMGVFLPAATAYPPASFFKVDVDSETGWHVGFGVSESSSRRKICDLHAGRFVRGLYTQPNTLNGLAVFSPIIPGVYRDTTNAASSAFTPLGEIPKVFYVCMENLTAAQQVVLGSTTYRVFPFLAKGTSSTNWTTAGSGVSAYFGFAVEE